MQCPNHDGELAVHQVQKGSSLPVSYSNCEVCGSYWLGSYDANYLPAASILVPTSGTTIHAEALTCPVCTLNLTRLQTDAIPAGTRAWQCPSGHGYFFPAEDLQRFRKAQEAKITYHKLWNIPLPPLSTVMLATLAVFLASSGFVVMGRMRQTQTTQSQAHEFFSPPTTLVAPNKSLLVAIKTTNRTTVTIHIDALGIEKILKTNDGLTHTLLVPNLPTGTHMLYFTAIVEGATIQSPPVTVEVP